MPGTFAKTVKVTINISIITVAVLSIVLGKDYLLSGVQPDTRSPESPAVTAGTRLSLRDVNWAENKRTLLMVLSDGCRFCTESAEFYKKLAQERVKRNDVRIVAVLPQEISVARAYLNKLGVSVDDVRQSPLNVVGVKGTPTLILVDDDGVIRGSWLGKQPAEKELEVLNRLRESPATRLDNINGLHSQNYRY